MSVVVVRLMDLDAAAEEEERRLEDFNEAEDARFFIGFGENETEREMCPWAISMYFGD